MIYENISCLWNEGIGEDEVEEKNIDYHKKQDAVVTIVGLGDVGGTLILGLRILGQGIIKEIKIFDPNKELTKRYEMEINQILIGPRVTICEEKDLFKCDYFVFTASMGVPNLDSKVSDVRMAQFEANKSLIDIYAKKAVEADFKGMFFQVSDPVDLLCREVLEASKRYDKDNKGLRPQQIQGFGLGVMMARARYYARSMGIDEQKIIGYGPHGEGLIIANAANEMYDGKLSRKLTEYTKKANMEIRKLGFKPYIAPALSSGAISIINAIKGDYHFSAIPIGNVYFGCENKICENGVVIKKENLCDEIKSEIIVSYDKLEKAFGKK